MSIDGGGPSVLLSRATCIAVEGLLPLVLEPLRGCEFAHVGAAGLDPNGVRARCGPGSTDRVSLY